MSTIEILSKVIRSGILQEELTTIPERGATSEEIAGEELLLDRSLSEQHKDILRKWNGLDLDVLRLFGCGQSEIPRISHFQFDFPGRPPGCVVIGSDPSGFLYFEDGRGNIWSCDTDGGSTNLLAKDLNDFFSRLVFGRDASRFAGDEWAEDIRKAGIIQ